MQSKSPGSRANFQFLPSFLPSINPYFHPSTRRDAHRICLRFPRPLIFQDLENEEKGRRHKMRDASVGSLHRPRSVRCLDLARQANAALGSTDDEGQKPEGREELREKRTASIGRFCGESMPKLGRLFVSRSYEFERFLASASGNEGAP